MIKVLPLALFFTIIADRLDCDPPGGPNLIEKALQEERLREVADEDRVAIHVLEDVGSDGRVNAWSICVIIQRHGEPERMLPQENFGLLEAAQKRINELAPGQFHLTEFSRSWKTS